MTRRDVYGKYTRSSFRNCSGQQRLFPYVTVREQEETCIENELDMKKALKELKKAGCNALVVYLGNFGPETVETLLAKEFDGPVMFAAAAEETQDKLTDDRGDAYCGMLNASYNLKLRNVKAYIPEYPVGTAEEVADMIHDFVPVARAVKDMEKELGEGNKKPQILLKLAQYELTLLDWIDKHRGSRKYVAIAGKCWPAFQTQFGFVPCYVNSRLTAKGIPVSCEVDIYGALSEFIGMAVSQDIVTLLDINNTVPDDMYESEIRDSYEYSRRDVFMGFHCGNTASEYIRFKIKSIYRTGRSTPGEDKIIWRDRCFCHTGNGKILPSRTYRKEFPASRSSCFWTFWKASV